jgi:hypothetical protein
LRLSHVALETAVQFSVPEPVLLIVTVWLAGFDPFWTAENARLAGDLPITGLVVAGGVEFGVDDGGERMSAKAGI